MTICCENKLSVQSNNKKELAEFINRVKGTEKNPTFSLESFLPCPVELYDPFKSSKDFDDDVCERLVAKYGYWRRHDWEEANWGTSPDIKPVKMNDDINSIVEILFFSCWSPPLNWLKAMTIEYPNIRFELKYDEPLRGIMGVFIAHGEKIFDKCIDYGDN